MSKKSTYLLGILLTIVVGSLLYWYLCCNVCCKKQNCDINNTSKTLQDNIAKPKVKKTTFIPFSVNDANGDFKFSIDESFNFKKSNFIINNIISENLNNGILNIKEYLDANGNKRFNITGYYTSDETNNSAFPNLGLARANSVKNYMTTKGILPKVINTFGRLKDDIVSDKNKDFLGPLSFDIFTRTNETILKDEKLKAICEKIKENPLKLYFDTGKAHINLSKEQREKFTSISRCIDKLGMTVQVIGHTDNTGNSENNMKLGQKRADFVKGYLVQNGIIKENIQTYSKGQNEPIANNATKEGRVKNRRIVVTITKSKK